MAPFLKVNPSLPCGNGFFTAMNSAWMPRINATRFSSVMGLLLGGTVAGTELEAGILSGEAPAPGTVIVAPGAAVPWARARAEKAVKTIRIGKCFGDMGVLHLYRAPSFSWMQVAAACASQTAPAPRERHGMAA